MKKVLTSLFLAAAAIPAYCQITLDQTTYPLPTDSVRIVDVSSEVGAIPTSGSSQTWNYSSINTTSGTVYYNTYQAVSSDPDFPAAQFVVRDLVKGLTPSVGYKFDQYYTTTAAGSEMIGIHVPAQAYGLGAFTGNNSDTLYVLDNVIYYPATPRPVVAFPATGNSAWQSSLRHVVNMELSVSSASLNHTPMQQAFYFNRQDTVIGWGTLQLPAQAGFNTSIPILQDRITQYCLDSLYVGGSPAPPTLTSAFGITQGQASGPIYNRIVFYREGSFNYQMLFNFTDNTFSTLYSNGGVYLNTELPVATGIDDINSSDLTSVIYPNPVTGTEFMIALTQNSKPAEIRIQDVAGRIIEKTLFTMNRDLMKVRLDGSLSDGIYIYSVRNAEGRSIATGKFCAAK
ncbi:MAG: hypothetical protein JWO03_2798 [Bacteroidetes bacterium]|nr:hypothetical protein [Bacteroidota bacterium]